MNQNGENYREPYRATKLWLEAVAIFRNGVPLGKNRLKFKSHENSFEAAGAITWFHAELQKRFDEGITRKQALALLQKFYKVGIFVHVNSTRVQDEKLIGSPQLASLVTSNSLDGLKESDFKDNGQIYRLGSLRDNHEVDEGEKKKEAGEKNETQMLPPSYAESMGKGNGASTRNFYVIVKPVEMEMIYRIWEQVFIQRFSRIVGCDVLTSFYGPGIIRGDFVAHNLTQNGKNGIVLTSDENEDMPPWLLSAMKCLASWPTHHSNDPGMPNYPNFETDVFKLVADYFGAFKGSLLTYKLYSAFITCFIRAELFDFNARLYSLNTSKTMNAPIQLKNRVLGDEYPFTASESVENLILDILTPAKSSRKLMTSAYKPKRIFDIEKPKEAKETLKPVVEGKEGNSVLSPTIDPISIRPMTPQDYAVDRYKNPFFYETAFTGEGSPITRVVSATELKTSMSSLPRRPLSLNTNSNVGLPMSSMCSIGSSGLPDASSYTSEYLADMTLNPNGRDENFKVGLPTVSLTSVTLSRPNSTIGLMCPSRSSHLIESNVDGSPYQPFVYENPNLELSASDIINHPKYTNLDLGELESSYSFCEYSGETSGSGGSGYGSGTSSYLDVEGVTRSASALQLSDGIKDRSPYVPPMKYPGNTPQPSSTSWFGFDGNNGKTTKTPANSKTESKSSFGLSMFGKMTKGLKHHYARDSPSKTVRRTLDFYYGADACVPGLMTAEGKMLAIQSFRLLTLLIPPTNRRHLQYLLRCMNKMSKNEKLKLDVSMTTRAIVINAFFRSVLSSEEIEEFDELLALRIVTFLMDNDTEIFSTKNEKVEMSTEVQDLTAKEQITKVPITPKKENKENEGAQDNFCAKISISEYEEQRLLGGTAQCLRDLLDAITHDEKMEEKTKRKRLKQFREEYPHIYFEKFGDEHDFLASGASVAGEKKSALRRFLRI